MKGMIFILALLYVSYFTFSLDDKGYFNKIRNQVDFESIQMTTNYGIVLSFKKYSEQYKEFYSTVERFVENLHRKFIKYSYLDLQAYSVDCSKSYVQSLCQKGDEYVILTIFEKDKIFQLEMEAEVSQPNESQYLNMIFKFFRNSWPNVHEIWNGKHLGSLINEKLAKDKLLLCYGEPDHVLGKNFCHQIGSTYRESEEISVGFVENKETLGDISDYFNLKIDVNQILPMFALWFLDCAHEKEKLICRSYRYLGDDLQENIHLFLKLNFMKNFDKMRKFGSIKELGDVPSPVLFCFHNNSTRKETQKIAKVYSEKLRGYAFVVTVNVDFVEENYLKEKMKLKLDELTKFPLYKFWPRTGAIPDTKIHFMLDVNEAPSEYVFKFYSNAYDLKLMYETTTGRDFSESMEKLTDPRSQDDEVELLLHHMKDVQCLKCPIDMKKVQILNRTKFNQWRNSNSTRMVLFWLGVDTSSKATAHILASASTMIPSDDKFGSVACNDWPDICSSMNIVSWPRIIILQNRDEYVEYKGVLEPESLANAVILHSQPFEIELNDYNLMQNFTDGSYLKLAGDRYLSTCTLGLFDSHDNKELYLKAAKHLHGRFFLAWTSKENARKWFEQKFGELKMPTLITFKNNDPIESYKFIPDDTLSAVGDIVSFVENSSRPKLILLTQLTYPILWKRFLPIFLLLSDNPNASRLYKILLRTPQCISESYQCATLNTLTESELTLHILDDWSLTAPHKGKDSLLYVNIEKGRMYSLHDDHNEKNVRKWIERLESGEVEPLVVTKTRMHRERPLMFNYLDLIHGSVETKESIEKLDKFDPNEQPMLKEEKLQLLKGPSKSRSKIEL